LKLGLGARKLEIYQSEEEQIAAIKRWWQENGKSIIAGIIIAGVGYFGWTAWQNAQITSGEAASNLYIDLLEAVEISVNTGDVGAAATVETLAGKLKEDHSSSIYALYAGMVAARQAVSTNDLVLAEEELQWVLDNSGADETEHLIARLRLARVLVAQKDEDSNQRALVLIEGFDAGAHAASYAEVKGDIYLADGRVAEARAAYSEAITIANEVGLNKPLIGIKLDDIAIAEDS